MSKAIVIQSPRFYGHYAVLLPDGNVIDCANLKTALNTAASHNGDR